MGKALPDIIVQKNQITKIGPYFKHSVGGLKIKEKTIVELSVENGNLIIHFNCEDDPFVNDNFYTQNNSEMWNQEVFEIFISTGLDDPTDYIEIEINPNNALFVTKIHNLDKQGTTLKSDLINPLESGIKHEINKKTDSWGGYLKIPLSLINYQKTENLNQFRVNFFRVILKEKQNSERWKCSAENSIFACWNSTMANEPEFHRSKYFGLLSIKK